MSTLKQSKTLSGGKNNIFLKREDLQPIFSFKLRGAYNKISKIKKKGSKRPVIAASAGNHAQGVALSARKLRTKAIIVMPKTTPSIKIDAVFRLGGEVVLHGNSYDDASEHAKSLASERTLTFIPPYDHPLVIAGQGTVGLEILEQAHSEIDAIFVPVGGGGLIAGCALAAKYFGDNCTVIGTEPFEVDDAYRSLISGKIETNITTNTIADGLRTQLGDKNFPIILNEVKKIIRITEDEIIDSMKLIWQRLKIICEPSCSLPLAGIIKNKDEFKGKKIGVVITGGNIDLDNLPF